MSKLISIGEALIDFIPLQKGVALKNVENFKRVAGGAPANVCACVSKLGLPAVILTKLGNDAFGDHIIANLNDAGVNTKHIIRTTKANTGLAFVSLKSDGNRDFSFYRNPSADMLYNEKDVPIDIFNKGDVLHFCSVALVDYPIRYAHNKAIDQARNNGCLISFDPNVRLPLWSDHDEYKRIINQYIDKADILKISDEELNFITGEKQLDLAIKQLFRGNVKIIIYTKGALGANIYTKDDFYFHEGFKIDAKDTTGSGDAFIGAFIYKLLSDKITLDNLNEIDFNKYLKFANAVGAIVATKLGAISSMPTKEEVLSFIKDKE